MKTIGRMLLTFFLTSTLITSSDLNGMNSSDIRGENLKNLAACTLMTALTVTSWLNMSEPYPTACCYRNAIDASIWCPTGLEQLCLPTALTIIDGFLINKTYTSWPEHTATPLGENKQLQTQPVELLIQQMLNPAPKPYKPQGSQRDHQKALLRKKRGK